MAVVIGCVSLIGLFAEGECGCVAGQIAFPVSVVLSGDSVAARFIVIVIVVLLGALVVVLAVLEVLVVVLDVLSVVLVVVLDVLSVVLVVVVMNGLSVVIVGGVVVVSGLGVLMVGALAHNVLSCWLDVLGLVLGGWSDGGRVAGRVADRLGSFFELDRLIVLLESLEFFPRDCSLGDGRLSGLDGGGREVDHLSRLADIIAGI